MPPWISFTGALIIISGVVFVFSRYSGLARLQQRTRDAWCGVEVQLRRRASLVPNLMQTVQEYAEHEREVFDEVGLARRAMQSADGPKQISGASNMLTRALGRVFAVVENYPQLRASESFQSMGKDLRDTEEKIVHARQAYNRSVLELNTRIQTYPDAAMARGFGFVPAEFFETDPHARAEIRVSFDRTGARPRQTVPPPTA
jgi:LemA protein